MNRNEFMIKCSECGNGVMKAHAIIDDSIVLCGRGMFSKIRHNGSQLKIDGKDVYFGILSHLDDEVIVVCSNFPGCTNHYVMKRYNYSEKHKHEKVGAVKIKGYGKHHFRR